MTGPSTLPDTQTYTEKHTTKKNQLAIIIQENTHTKKSNKELAFTETKEAISIPANTNRNYEKVKDSNHNENGGIQSI